MDQFGVTNPKLKALALSPFISAENKALLNEPVIRDTNMRDFLGAEVKNIIGQVEISAYGLPGEIGVLTVQVPSSSTAENDGLKDLEFAASFLCCTVLNVLS
ncbi:MAG: hypothetical protein JW787_09800 [Sedimentisphaerales bacterium]|nr:hypothetical protein [Sedimentisphaerales bacterium]